MHKHRWLFILSIIFVSLFGVLAAVVRAFQLAPSANMQITPTPSLTITTPTPVPTLASTPTSTPTPLSPYGYPMTNYEERKSVRWYGKDVTTEDRKPLPCGEPFVGFHTGDDLEALEEENETEVPVYAIAPGTVKQVKEVGGYGGLIVIEHTIEGKTYTGYYGHIDLKRTKASVGDTVTTGEHITDLGDHCSVESSNERKHLHFSIREGSDIDVRGYVDDQATLASWLNPETFLATLNARRPENQINE